VKLTIESTDHVLMVGDLPARVWRGQTAGGLPLVCLVARITPGCAPWPETIDMKPAPFAEITDSNGEPVAYVPA
jgi:hypothetical protein